MESLGLAAVGLSEGERLDTETRGLLNVITSSLHLLAGEYFPGREYESLNSKPWIRNSVISVSSYWNKDPEHKRIRKLRLCQFQRSPRLVLSVIHTHMRARTIGHTHILTITSKYTHGIHTYIHTHTLSHSYTHTHTPSLSFFEISVANVNS